jgi:hypothetical protein
MPKAEKKEAKPVKEKKAAKPVKEKKEKKEKKVKDPNAPKGPLGAYMFFCKDKRESVKAKHADWGVAEIGRELGGMWKALTDKDKKKYEDQAAKDKDRYKKEMEKYEKTK